jgi:hypothetical protein
MHLPTDPGRRRVEHVGLGLAGRVTVGHAGDEAAQLWFGLGEVAVGGEQESGLVCRELGMACFQYRDHGSGAFAPFGWRDAAPVAAPRKYLSREVGFVVEEGRWVASDSSSWTVR